MWFLQAVVMVILVGGAYAMGIDQGESQERERLERQRQLRAMGGTNSNKYL
jgi:hypothetical protein